MSVHATVTPERSEAIAGGSAEFDVSITNTSELLDRYSVETFGVEVECVTTEPSAIALFPGDTGTIRVKVSPPLDHPATLRSVAFNVRSDNDSTDFAVAQAHLAVQERTNALLSIDPNVTSGGKAATFSLVVRNDGNTPFDAAAWGLDPENLATIVFDPEVVRVPAGGSAVVTATAVGGRAWFGAPRPRTFAFGLAGDLSPGIPGVFLQRPRIGRWLISLLGLLAAAAVFGLVMYSAFNKAVDEAGGVEPDQVEQAFDTRDPDAQTVPWQPGVLAGQLASPFGNAGLAGIQVQAYTADNRTQAVGSGVTNEKGEYEVGGLAKVPHVLRFSGAGFDPVWSGGADNPVDAKPLDPKSSDDAAGIQSTEDDDGLVISGRPGSIRGVVAQGDPVGAIATLFEVEQSLGAEVDSVAVSADGSFFFAEVPAPNVYELVIEQEGYGTVLRTIRLDAAEEVGGVEVLLQAADGAVTGFVEAIGGTRLGGVTVTATDGENVTTTVSFTEPRETTSTGEFILRNLPVPGRYAITVDADGYGSETRSVVLTDAEPRNNAFNFTLTDASGSIGGVAALDDVGASGGITVSVVGPNFEVSTTSVSAGAGVGTYVIDPIPVPGVYTVTFSRKGYVSEIQLVELDALRNVIDTRDANTTLTTATGVIGGTVVQNTTGADSCDGLRGVRCATGVDVIISDGSANEYRVITANGPAGRFEVSGIPPGSYTVRASLLGADDAVQLVSVVPAQVRLAGTNRGLILRLGVQAGISGLVVDGAGLPVANAAVRLIPISGFPGGSEPGVQRGCTDASGRYSFTDIGGDQVFLVAVYRSELDPVGEELDSLQVTSATGTGVEAFRNLVLATETAPVPC